MGDEKKPIATSSPASTSMVAEDKSLDCSVSNRGVWLVKVPKYISDRWSKLEPNKEIGRLQISKGTGGVPQISFILSDDVLAVKDNSSSQDRGSDVDMEDASSPSVNGADKKKNEPTPISRVSSTILGRSAREISMSKLATKRNVTIPREHKFQISEIQNQTLAVYSETIDTKKLAVEGVVVQKGECRPQATKDYMSLKQENFRRVQQPQRSVMQLDKAVVSYKPISMHVNDVADKEKKKEQGKKSREDKDKVQDMLFRAFEKHQYYTLKDLEKITRQPIPYLKEILREICIYNAKNPHKNMYELKPEYRHYKDDGS